MSERSQFCIHLYLSNKTYLIDESHHLELSRHNALSKFHVNWEEEWTSVSEFVKEKKEGTNKNSRNQHIISELSTLPSIAREILKVVARIQQRCHAVVGAGLVIILF